MCRDRVRGRVRVRVRVRGRVRVVAVHLVHQRPDLGVRRRVPRVRVRARVVG